MGELNIKDMAELKEFLKWRRKNPKEYKQFLEDLKSFFQDMIGILR